MEIHLQSIHCWMKVESDFPPSEQMYNIYSYQFIFKILRSPNHGNVCHRGRHGMLLIRLKILDTKSQIKTFFSRKYFPKTNQDYLLPNRWSPHYALTSRDLDLPEIYMISWKLIRLNRLWPDVQLRIQRALKMIILNIFMFPHCWVPKALPSACSPLQAPLRRSTRGPLSALSAVKLKIDESNR